MSEEENRREDFDVLEAAGLEVFVSFPTRVEQIPSWVERLGAVVGCEVQASALSQAIAAAVDAMNREVASSCAAPAVFCPIWRKPWMSFNRDTYCDAVLRLCGGRNVCAAERDRYCRVPLEAIASRCPDVALLPDEPYPFREKHVAELRGLRTRRGSACRVRFIDGRALSWYGSRIPAALPAIRAAISEDLP